MRCASVDEHKKVKLRRAAGRRGSAVNLLTSPLQEMGHMAEYMGVTTMMHKAEENAQMALTAAQEKAQGAIIAAKEFSHRLM